MTIPLYLRFDREIAPEHNAGFGGREVVVGWEIGEAYRFVELVAGCGPSVVGFRCEQHGDLLAYVEEARIATPADVERFKEAGSSA